MKKSIFLTFSFLLASHMAWAEDAMLPTETTNGNISYISGGIGKDEAMALQQAEKDYPLSLEFTVTAKPRDQFTSDVHIKLIDQQGNIVLNTVSNGPFFLVKLPSGHYRLEASKYGETKVRQVDIRSSAKQKILIEWAG